jgi:chaperone required for assembly of F1-ATPase
MSPAQLTVVMQAVTNLGSAVLGILLAKEGLEVEPTVSALTVTAQYLARYAHEEPEEADMFVAEMSQTVRRLLQYVRLST